VAGPDEPDEKPGAPEATPASVDEPRARDIASSKSTADLEDRLDPETIAQLAGWFGLPSFEQLEEQEAERVRAAAEADVWAERRQLHARIEGDADPRVLALLDRWRDAGHGLLAVPPPPELHVALDLVRVDQLADHMGSIAEPRENERPEWIEDVVAVQTAQAILRDLHRPETTFDIVYEYGPREPTLRETTDEIRKVFLASYRVRPEPPVRTLIAEGLAELRKWKGVDWAELPIERRPRPEPVSHASVRFGVEAEDPEDLEDS
jgi:hypothetical protein